MKALLYPQQMACCTIISILKKKKKNLAQFVKIDYHYEKVSFALLLAIKPIE